jgi:hypothetical protein
MSAERGWIGDPQPSVKCRDSHYSRQADRINTRPDPLLVMPPASNSSPWSVPAQLQTAALTRPSMSKATTANVAAGMHGAQGEHAWAGQVHRGDLGGAGAEERRAA